MECQMLSVLDFQVTVPTIAHFLCPLLRMNDCDEPHAAFVRYLTELTLLDHHMLRSPPSHIVCAAIFLSNERAGRMQPWSAVLREHTKHTEEQLRPCVEQLRKLVEKIPLHRFQAISKKYQSSAHHKVAIAWPQP